MNNTRLKILIQTFEENCQSKFFQLAMVILINLGGIHLSNDIKFFLEYLFTFHVMKFLLIFAISITVTKDLLLSICATLVVGISFCFFLNEKSKFCLISKKYIQTVEKFHQQKNRQMKKNEKKKA
jgi:hypothetical protein